MCKYIPYIRNSYTYTGIEVYVLIMYVARGLKKKAFSVPAWAQIMKFGSSKPDHPSRIKASPPKTNPKRHNTEETLRTQTQTQTHLSSNVWGQRNSPTYCEHKSKVSQKLPPLTVTRLQHSKPWLSSRKQSPSFLPFSFAGLLPMISPQPATTN